jgi:hypothetical protein
VLLLLMAGIGSYLLAGQFATYIAIWNLQSGLQHLEAANDALAAQLRTLELSGKRNKQIAGELTTASGENFPQRTVTVWRDENGLILSTGGVLLEARPAKVPDVIKGDFSGFVIDQDSLHLRAVKRPADSFLPPKGSPQPWGPPVDCRRGSSFFAPEPRRIEFSAKLLLNFQFGMFPEACELRGKSTVVLRCLVGRHNSSYDLTLSTEMVRLAEDGAMFKIARFGSEC